MVKRRLSHVGSGRFAKRRRTISGSTIARRARARSVLRRFVRRRRKSRQDLALIPRMLGVAQPAKIMVKMKNVITNAGTEVAGGWESILNVISLNRLRDPETATANQTFPDNFVNYARMYEKYRVHGLKIACQFLNLDNNANNGMYSCFYAVPAVNNTTEPTDPMTIASVTDANALLQERSIRRKFIAGSGFASEGRWAAFHKGGYFSVKRTQGTRALSADEYEGSVTAAGAAVTDPLRRPVIIHKLMSANTTGFKNGGEVRQVRYFLTYYVEWYGRRREFEGIRTEV